MTGLDTLQIVIVGASTGFGSALGAEFASYLVDYLKARQKSKAMKAEASLNGTQ